MYAYLDSKKLDEFINLALSEDLGDGDHSTLSSVPYNAEKTAELRIKSDGIIAGLALAKRIFYQVEPSLEIDFLKQDGDSVSIGEIAFRVSGSARAILSAERLVLNCMQRMSGIATLTHKYVGAVKGTQAKILDTRKTTPNARIIEKWAVKIGGGQNHRYALFDMIMLKDNHVDFAGGIRQAIEGANHYIAKHNKDLKIEIETRNLQEVREVLEVGKVDIIMLDNMSPDLMREAVEIIGKRFETEASGGITLDTVSEVAQTGVDAISVGALTHSYQSLDLSLKAIS
ncbi:MAG: carboxylating nicotinate-nucleotide diphosphorylase [Bernardetiaceae bacterium]|nr:carboxylating nicotinate-nucleotide diphosphorylase [Bernardetiaceae bacterium]